MSPQEDPPREAVTVEVIIPAEAESFSGARLRARLDDVTMADAPAERLDVSELHDVAHQAGRETRLQLSLSFPPGRHGLVVVNIHIARHASGEIRRGDLINMESCPVQSGPGGPVKVIARQV